MVLAVVLAIGGLLDVFEPPRGGSCLLVGFIYYNNIESKDIHSFTGNFYHCAIIVAVCRQLSCSRKNHAILKERDQGRGGEREKLVVRRKGVSQRDTHYKTFDDRVVRTCGTSRA